jgi:hypothetical protein
VGRVDHNSRLVCRSGGKISWSPTLMKVFADQAAVRAKAAVVV